MFKVDVLQSLVVRAGQNSKAAGVRWLLQQESNTWRLITSLYRYLLACLTEHVCVPVYLFLNDHLCVSLGTGSRLQWKMT